LGGRPPGGGTYEKKDARNKKKRNPKKVCEKDGAQLTRRKWWNHGDRKMLPREGV